MMFEFSDNEDEKYTIILRNGKDRSLHILVVLKTKIFYNTNIVGTRSISKEFEIHEGAILWGQMVFEISNNAKIFCEKVVKNMVFI